MSKYFKWILLLVLWNSILFYGKNLGISVILFIIPLLIFLIYVFKDKDLIKNKWGLLIAIPILLLSMTYFIFDNMFFRILNLLVIPALFIIMYIMVVNPSDKIAIIVRDFISLIFRPLGYVGTLCDQIEESISSKLKMSENMKKVIKVLVIVIPISFVIIFLLSSADMIFNNIFSSIFDSLRNILEDFSGYNLVGRLISMFLLFGYLSLVILFIVNDFSKEKNDLKEEKRKDAFTMKVLLTVLNVVYVIFDIIQIKSLMFHSVGDGVTYAEYARQGFFELMFVSIINISIILLSKKYKSNDKKYIDIMSIIMVILTFIIIVSAFIRMYLYEAAYGYTLLRLLVYITLITEVILLVLTIKYIINPNTKIVRDYMIIIVSVYTFINFINIDRVIAEKNIERYYDNKKIDLFYLENYSADNIPCLIDLYKNTKDKKIKKELQIYFRSYDISIDGFQEWNLAKDNGKKMVDGVTK